MASTYVNDLRLNEMATGDESGNWGVVTNLNLELIGEALGYGTEGITTNADTHTTTVADGATDPGRAMYIEYTGTLDSACTITIAPNTLNRMHFIENGTSGSQNIIIKQGSGATITIPPGDTKAVYLDGAGSGAAVVDAFASLSVVDLKVQDDLTVTDDATIGGTLGVTGIVTLTDDLIIGDGKTIGSASDVDAITIAANGQLTLTQTLIGTALDISGDIDVDGTSNLDIVDIDGAVDMASTLQVDGAITSSAGATITTADNNPQMTLVSTDADANVGPVLKLYRNSGSPADDDILGRIQWSAEDDAGNDATFARINVVATDVSNDSEDARMEFAPAVADDFTPTMSLSGGNVGIGTTSPAAQLHVSAATGDCTVLIEAVENSGSREPHLQLKGTNTSSNPIIEFGDSGGFPGTIEYENQDNSMRFGVNAGEKFRITGNNLFLNGGTDARIQLGSGGSGANTVGNDTVHIRGDGDNMKLNTADNGTMVFEINGSEKMRMNSDGEMVIGTSSNPQDADLCVQGPIDGQFALVVAKGTTTGTTSQLFVGFLVNDGNSGSGMITANGTGQAAFGAFSDIRLKENINDLPSQLDKIMAMRPVEFDYIESRGGGHQEGFIAQEIEKIYPDVVGEADDGFKTLTALGKWEARLVKAVQEQQEQIEQLKTEIKTLQ